MIGTALGLGIAPSAAASTASGVLAYKGAKAQASAAERASAVGTPSGGFFRRGFDSPDLRDADRFERLVLSQLAQHQRKRN
jgi:hypothetical protein